MKKLSLLLTMVFAVSVLFAQKGKVNSAASNLRSGKLDKAKALIDEGISHKKCVEWPKSYYVKGQVYQGIFESPLPAYKKLSDTPLETAYEAYKKLIELDVKKKYTKKLEKQYSNLAIDFASKGANSYNEKNYEAALKAFKTTLEIENSDILKGRNVVDTPVIYYTGLTAYNLKKYEEAIPYYLEALKYKYEEAKCYAALANSYKEINQKEKAVEYLHKGYELFPENLYMLGQLINFYLLGGEPEKAEKYLDAAIVQDPTNISFYLAKGTYFEKTDQPDEAVKMYKKALELDASNFTALYNIGLVEYNKNVKFHQAVNDIVDNDKYSKEIVKVLDGYEALIPIFEKANESRPTEIAPVLVLKELYFKVRNRKPEYMEKYKEFKAKQEAMDAAK